MSRFESHLARPKQLELEREDGTKDVFDIYPLPWSKIAELIQVMKKFSVFSNKKEEEVTAEMFLSQMDKDTITTIQDLCYHSLKKGYPGEDDNKIKDFCATHLFEILPVLFEVNSFSTSTPPKQVRNAIKG